MSTVIHCHDKMVIVDGVGALLEDQVFPSGIWCVQWDGVQGEIEYIDRTQKNKTINSVAEYQYLIDAYHLWIAASINTPTLEEIRAAALAEIDSSATDARDKYRSKDKDATYLNKSAELDRYIAAGRPDPVLENEYPYLYHEALETEMTVTAVATLIETTRSIWVPTIDPLIEGKCRGGKVKVEAATTAEEIETTLNDAITALEAI